MAEPLQLIGSVDVSIPLFLQDLAGAGKPGLVAADLSCRYYRRRAAPVLVDLVDLANIDSEHADGGIIAVPNMPGHYRLDLPDAVAAAGSPFAVLLISGSDVLPCNVQLPLWQFNDSHMEAMRKELLNSRINSPLDRTHVVLDDDDFTVHSTRTVFETIVVEGASFELSSLQLMAAGAFTRYRWQPGDLITITAGSGARLGQVEIASRIDDDTIELAEAIAEADVDDDSIAGSIGTGRQFIQRS